MADHSQPLPWKISAFWFVAFLAAAVLVFKLTSAWYLHALGYVSGFLSFGALLELWKARR